MSVLPDTEFVKIALPPAVIAEYEEWLQSTLDEALAAVHGRRAFLALVDMDRGMLVVRFTAGDGWDAEKKQRRLTLSQPRGDFLQSRRGITGHVAQTGQPYVSHDVRTDPHYIKFFEDVRSEVAVPVIDPTSGRTLGVLNVDSTEVGGCTEEHIPILMKFADRAAFAVSMVEHQAREQALIEIGKELSSTVDIDHLIRRVVEGAREILRADDASVFLMDEARQVLTLAASHGPLSAKVGQEETTYHLGEGLTGWVAQHREAIRTGDPRNDPRWKGHAPEMPPGEIAAFLAVPIEGTQGLIGVLRVVRRRKAMFAYLPAEFTETDVDVLKTLASQLAVTISRARLNDRLLQTERMAAWGEMSARSAHMIGNAVFALKGNLSELRYLINTYQCPPGAPALLERVMANVYRIEEILSEYKDFVLATQITLSACNINDLLWDVTADCLPSRCCVTLHLQLADDLPPVMVDAKKLKRCFSEMIENAIDFQPSGGDLTISSQLATEAEVRSFVPPPRAARYVKVEFADAGPGLAPEDKERVFTPFFTRKAKGMGLGLAIVKGIIDAHKGVIREVGTPGAGARFVILLPVKDG
ncbi:MAG: GAF domain-containing protein [Abditibacteriales bacterium]|nr:GAF domain-containing protein [Abditibacteriales bacterium]